MLTHHPGGEAIELYLLSRMPESLVSEIEEHLLLCDDCRSLCNEIEERIRDIRTALRANISETQ